jgi:hypothetical protein
MNYERRDTIAALLGFGLVFVAYPASYVGGTMLTGWLCIEVFDWPKWAGIVLAVTIGGTVGAALVFAITTPFLLFLPKNKPGGGR